MLQHFIRTIDELLEEAAHAESMGDQTIAERFLHKALYQEERVEEMALLNQRAAQRMGRQADACMNHRNPQADCPACL